MESNALSSLSEQYSEYDYNDGRTGKYEKVLMMNDSSIKIGSDGEYSNEVEFIGVTKVTDLDNIDPHQVDIPPDPIGTCPEELQQRVKQLKRITQVSGKTINDIIQEGKSFRNPQIYEKLVDYIGINEYGTNYDPRKYDPNRWKKEKLFGELAEIQRDEMERRILNTRIKLGQSKKKSSNWENQILI